MHDREATLAEGGQQALHAGDLRPVQVGFVNRRMFVVNASVGLYPKMLADREIALTVDEAAQTAMKYWSW